MGRKKTKRLGECIYFGKIGPISEDHVPPKCIFAKPRPTNLIKVPACEECHSQNKQVSKDDEYFRLMLPLREDTANHPDVKQILPTVLRSLARPDKIGFTTSLLKNIHPEYVTTRSGLISGIKNAYNVDLARLDNVAIRITKGLFFYEMGYRMPNEYQAISFSETGLQHFSAEWWQDLRKDILIPLASTTPKIIGNRVFSYQYLPTYTDPKVTVWLLSFYEKVRFLCMTLPKQEMLPLP